MPSSVTSIGTGELRASERSAAASPSSCRTRGIDAVRERAKLFQRPDRVRLRSRRAASQVSLVGWLARHVRAGSGSPAAAAARRRGDRARRRRRSRSAVSTIRERDARSSWTRRVFSSSISEVAASPSTTSESVSSVGSWISAATGPLPCVTRVTPRARGSRGSSSGAPYTSTYPARSGAHRASTMRRIPKRVADHLLHSRRSQRLPARAHGDLPEAHRREHVPPDQAEENRDRNRHSQRTIDDPHRRRRPRISGENIQGDHEPRDGSGKDGGHRGNRAAQHGLRRTRLVE